MCTLTENSTLKAIKDAYVQEQCFDKARVVIFKKYEINTSDVLTYGIHFEIRDAAVSNLINLIEFENPAIKETDELSTVLRFVLFSRMADKHFSEFKDMTLKEAWQNVCFQGFIY